MEQDAKTAQLSPLISLFSANIAQYKSSQYDEANTRTDFIDKFFTLLDWDIANNQGFSESYREVVREDKVKIYGATKAPDYSFRIFPPMRILPCSATSIIMNRAIARFLPR